MKPRTLLFVTQCGPETGFGHVVRMKLLARALGRRHRVAFLSEGLGTNAAAIIPDNDLVDAPPRGTAAVITDLIRPDEIRSFRAATSIRPCISLHDMGLAQYDSDCAIDGSVVRAVPYSNGRPNLFLGPEYSVIDPKLLRAIRHRRRTRRSVFLSFGGGDVRSIYRKAFTALDGIPTPLELSACRGYTRWREVDSKAHAVRWLGPADRLGPAMASSMFAICAAGVTLYELASAGVPALVISHHKLQSMTAREFERRGAAISLGTASRVSARAIRLGASTLLCARETRRRMSRAGRRIVDGRGLMRVVRIIERIVKEGA